MNGVVLETLSNRKLVSLTILLVLLQIVFFLIGGLIAPAPSHAENILSTKCLDKGNKPVTSRWFWPRNTKTSSPACTIIDSYDDPKLTQGGYGENNIVFTFQFPNPRDSVHLDMSRWFQHIVAVLQTDVLFVPHSPMVDNAVMMMDVRIGYRNKYDADHDWKEIARSDETRHLDCSIDEHMKREGYHYNCSVLSFFELGSCHHDYYLVNLRLPVLANSSVNHGLGIIDDMWLVEIHQNGGFTKVWFSIKTVMFPLVLGILIWYWRRVLQQERATNLLERTLMALGLAMTLLNCPIEWLTLYLNMPYMLLLGDIRQGLFYSVLLSFWIIFTGEHLMDQVERNKLTMYWKHLSAVAFACICLFVFDMCERGVQLTNPFFSIWADPTGAKVALSFIILAGLSGGCYFIFLCYMIYRVFKNISAKRTALPAMSKNRRKYYQGLIYRFKAMMLSTLVLAAMTVCFFVVSQVSEGYWKWGEENRLEYTSAFFTGVYGMWNVYVFMLLCLYAPSHKYMPVMDRETTESNDEDVVFTTLPSEASVLTTFVQKSSMD